MIGTTSEIFQKGRQYWLFAFFFFFNRKQSKYSSGIRYSKGEVASAHQVSLVGWLSSKKCLFRGELVFRLAGLLQFAATSLGLQGSLFVVSYHNTSLCHVHDHGGNVNIWCFDCLLRSPFILLGHSNMGLSLISVSIWSIEAFSGVKRTGWLLECLGLLPSLWPIVHRPIVLQSSVFSFICCSLL